MIKVRENFLYFVKKKQRRMFGKHTWLLNALHLLMRTQL